ncbi:hypothetical protein [Sphingomonas sp. UYEF23]|uniref:hypothetical protein n=1 Tax=Sphingomonas sp. UYEF23 TaxID=1756408 RepID=UPI003397B797
MKPLRQAQDMMGNPVDRDTRRACPLVARREPIGSIPRKGIVGGFWDGGNVVGAFRDGSGTFTQPLSE